VSLQGVIASGWRLLRIRLLAILVILLMCNLGSFAYSVLTHEEIVDLLWKDEIRPLLLKRFPALTEDQITAAHAYAYGGAVIQDLGTTIRQQAFTDWRITFVRGLGSEMTA